jgi:hypothetical protein
LTEDDVKKRLESFQKWLAAEQSCQQELLNLNIHGSRDQVEKAQARHEELIAEIERIRMEEMMPILEEVSEFVSVSQARELEGGEK